MRPVDPVTDRVVPMPDAPRGARVETQDEVAEAPFAEADEPVRPWSRDEVAALGPRLGSMPPWRLVVLQLWAAVACIVAVGLWVLVADSGAIAGAGHGVLGSPVFSAAYGSACAVLPSALMAWGLSRRSPGATSVGLAVRFLSLEFVKIGVSVVMLLLAPWLLPTVHWLALLAGLVLCTKVMWLAPLLVRRAT